MNCANDKIREKIFSRMTTVAIKALRVKAQNLAKIYSTITLVPCTTFELRHAIRPSLDWTVTAISGKFLQEF